MTSYNYVFYKYICCICVGVANIRGWTNYSGVLTFF